MFSIIFLLYSLVPLIQAATNTYHTCTTKLGTKSLSPLSSTTYALTVTATAKVTQLTVPVITITSGNLISTTTVTSTKTVFTTTTTTPSTTVQPPAGFTPIGAVSVQPPMEKRSERAPMRFEKRAQPSQIIVKAVNGKMVAQPPLYPEKVVCGKLVKVVVTSTITKAVGTTSTILIPTPLVTITITAKTTSTSTVTETTPTETIYAACLPQANNLLKNIDGFRFTAATGNEDVYLGSRSNYECCAICQQDPACVGSFTYPASESACWNTRSTISCPSEYPPVAVKAASMGAYEASNGICGGGFRVEAAASS